MIVTLIAAQFLLIGRPAAQVNSRPAKPKIVCIDPGHPSENGSGSTGKHISEVQAAWQVAVKLKSLLVGKGIKVVMTKTAENQVVKNRIRAEIANRAYANLAVRLHCESDGFFGFAVYFPDRQGTVDGVTGPAPEVIEASRSAAKPIHDALVTGLKGILRDRGLKVDIETRVGSKQGALTGSIYSKVPVVLVEMCVLSNAKDEAFIISPEGQAKMVQSLAAGVQAALKQKSQPKKSSTSHP